MTDKPLFKGEELYMLFPQRKPIVMVDTFFCADEEGAETGLTVTDDNIFCEAARLREPGIIEHIAQSAAAFAGYAPYTRGEQPKLGFIGEIKKMKIQRLPLVGDSLHTRLHVMGEAAGVTLIKAETDIAGDIIATCQMKIFIEG